MTAMQLIAAIIGAFFLLGFVGWALVHAGSLGEDDPEEYEEIKLASYDSDAWKHAVPKVPHAE